MVPDEPTTLGDRGTYPLGADARRLDTRSRQHYGKFLASHPPEYVIGAKRSGGYHAELSDHLVADRMAMAIVDSLESIKIEHHHRNRRAVASATLQNSSGAVQKSSSIGDAGER